MIIHFSVLGVILVVALLWERYEKFNKLKSNDYVMHALPFIIIFGYLAFLAAMRTGMNDTSVYIFSFENIPGTFADIRDIFSSDGKDKAFDITANFFKMLFSDNYHWWFAFFAIIESLIFVHVLRRESASILVSCFYFFASTLYYNYFSMMRQWMAVALFFLAFKFIKEKKFWQYLIICLIAAQFHNSAYLCIPVYFFSSLKPWSKKQLSLVAAFCVAMLFLNPLLSSLEGSDSTYNYVYSTMATNSGSSPVRIIIAAVPVILCFIYRERIEQEHNKSLDVAISMSILNLLLTVVATFTSGLYLIRMSTYFNLFNMIVFSWLLEKIIRGQNKSVIKLCFYVFYLAFYVYQMYYQGAFGYSSDILGTFN